MSLQFCIKNKKNEFDLRKKINIRLFWGMAYVVSMIIFATIQLLLGTDEIIIVMAFISLLCCAIPLFLFGIDDIGAVFVFVLLSKYSFFPLWIKTLVGERIDIGLTSPLLTFEMALVGSVISCLALLLAKFIPVKRGLLDYHLNHQQMLLAGYLATGFGLLFLTLHVIFVPVILPSGEVTRGFGGFGSLIGPLYFGIGCLTVISLKPNTNPIHKIFLLLVFIMLIVLSLQTNAKAEFTVAVFAFVLTIFYFRIKIKARFIIYSCLFLVFYFFVFAPIIHLTRTDVFKTADFSGKIAIIENMFSSNLMNEFAGQSREIFNYNYYPSIHTFVVDRLEMIQDMDIPAGGIWRGNTIGWFPVQRAIESALPSFLVGNKSNISDADLIAYNAGYFPILITLNHTIGIFGSAYAMFLWPGLVFISLAVLFLYLLLLRLMVLPKLWYNLFGIYFLSRYVFVFSEQSVQALLIALLRFIPIDVILITVMVFLTANIYFYLPKVNNTSR
jgi:hypothetical protein